MKIDPPPILNWRATDYMCPCYSSKIFNANMIRMKNLRLFNRYRIDNMSRLILTEYQNN